MERSFNKHNACYLQAL